MAKFHFVEDYERHVNELVARHPIDEAMALAVGGHYEAIGDIELVLLRHAGLRDGMAVLDLGCGSGRLASAIHRSGLRVRYAGIDIVQALLDYGAAKTSPEYEFILHRDLSIPRADASQDIACAFSVFTHLLHHESYIYMEDFHRVLRPGGKLVFSFHEFAAPAQWHTFQHTVDQHRQGASPHLNMFIERGAINVWAGRLGYRVEGFVNSDQALEGSTPLGQSTVILERI